MNTFVVADKSLKIQNSALKLNATWAFLLTQAIVVPFFLVHKISLADIFFIQFLHALVVFLSDLPSSIIADWFGRRWVLIAACLLRGVGGISFALSEVFNDFLVTYIIIGLGNGFFSGVNISTLFDSSPNDKSSYNNLFKINYHNTRLMTILSLLSGSLIANISLYAVAILNAFLAWLPLLYAIDLPLKARNSAKLGVRQVIDYLPRNDFHFMMIILSISFYSFLPVFNLYLSQVFFQALHYPIFYYGITISICQIVIILISRFLKFNKDKVISNLLIISILTCISYLFYYQLNLVTFMISNLCFEFIRYLNSTTLICFLNINTDIRIHSVINSTVNIVSTIFLLIFGSISAYLFDNHGYKATVLACLGLCVLAGLIFVYYYYMNPWGKHE